MDNYFCPITIGKGIFYTTDIICCSDATIELKIVIKSNDPTEALKSFYDAFNNAVNAKAKNVQREEPKRLVKLA